jgi:hypothetical protein
MMLKKLHRWFWKIKEQYKIDPRKGTLVNMDWDKNLVTFRTYPNWEFIRNHNVVVGSISILFSILIWSYIHPVLIIPVIIGATKNIYGIGSSLTWTNPTEAGGAPDGRRASDNSGNDGDILNVGGFGDQSGLGTFVSARCAINLRDNGQAGDDDELLFKEDVLGSVTTLATFITSSEFASYIPDTNIFYNSTEVTSWINLQNLVLTAEINTVGGAGGSDNFTWEVDSMFVEVTYKLRVRRQKVYNFGFTTIQTSAFLLA